MPVQEILRCLVHADNPQSASTTRFGPAVYSGYAGALQAPRDWAAQPATRTEVTDDWSCKTAAHAKEFHDNLEAHMVRA